MPPLEADIIQNILSRLPLKSLLRFKAVCRSWNATINDWGFAKIHSNQLNISNSRCFYATDSSGDGTYKLIEFQGQELHVQSVVQFPLKAFKSAYFLCCCEGLLLFKHSFDEENGKEKYVLWNPFTRNYSTFSCLRDSNICYSYPVSYGIFYDRYEDDYKVIVLLIRKTEYLVYSIKNDRWTQRECDFGGKVYFRGIYADGAVYWTMILAGSCCNTIIYFDPKDNLIKKLHKPKDLKHANSLVCLTNLRGNLCFYTRDQELRIEIWMLKEYGGRRCWMKLMTADNLKSQASDIDQIFVVPRPMYFTSNNEVVFHDHEGKRYAVYSLEKQKFVEVKEFPACTKMIGLTCLESLHFPATQRERR